MRSFSLCSLLPGYKGKDKWKATTPEDRQEMNAEREIEKFEKDFVLSMWKQDTSVSKGLSTLHGSLRSSNKKLFHSSSDSILTDTDSGAFSVSEYSDVSDSLISIENPLHKTADCEGIVTVNGLCYQSA